MSSAGRPLGASSISEERLLKAMVDSYGNLSIIAGRLGCIRVTIANKIIGTKSHLPSKAVRELYQAEQDKIGDIVEDKILTIMNETIWKTFSIVEVDKKENIIFDDNGKEKMKKFSKEYPSPQAARMIEFYADRKLKDRGYFTKTEIAGKMDLKVGSLKEYAKAKKKYDKKKDI